MLLEIILTRKLPSSICMLEMGLMHSRDREEEFYRLFHPKFLKGTYFSHSFEIKLILSNYNRVHFGYRCNNFSVIKIIYLGKPFGH
jgi:hypothetical protein